MMSHLCLNFTFLYRLLQIAFFYFYFSSIGKDGKKKLLSIISIYYRLLSIDPLFIDSDGDVNSFHIKNIGELVVVQFCLNMVNSVQVVTSIHIDLN